MCTRIFYIKKYTPIIIMIIKLLSLLLHLYQIIIIFSTLTFMIGSNSLKKFND